MAAVLAGCSSYGTLPPAQQRVTSPGTTPEYLIGPTDTLNVFVWRNPDLTTTIPVRPDGRTRGHHPGPATVRGMVQAGGARRDQRRARISDRELWQDLRPPEDARQTVTRRRTGPSETVTDGATVTGHR